MPTLTVAGHSVTVGDEFLKLTPDEQNSAVDEISKSLPAEAPSGIIAGLQHGLAQHVQGMGETAKDFAGMDNSGTNSAAANIEPKNYKEAPIIQPGGHWYNPSDINFKNIPQNIAEAAPGVAQDVAVGATVGKVNKWAGLAAGIGSTLLRTLGPMAKENAVKRTGDPDAEPSTADKERAVAVAAAQAPINAVGLGRVLPGVTGKVAGVGIEGASNALKKYLTTVGTEGAAGAARDAVGQVGSTIGTDKGIQYDPNETASSAITGAAGGGLLAAPRVAGDVASATKFRKFGGDNAEAATALANRQLAAADGKSLVGPLGGTKTAADAVNAAHADVHTELAAASKDENLSTDNANTLKRINAGGPASKTELSDLADEASPDTMHLARQALLSKQLKSMGNLTDDKFTGGVSGQMEDKLRAIYNPTAAAASLGASALGLPAMIGLSPHIVAGTYGGYAAARALDKVTGARSPAQGFTDKFADANVHVRTPAAVPVPPAPVTTSVPQVTPPQNTAVWGNPAAPQPNLRATLNTNAKLTQGMAQIAKQLGAAKKASMITAAMPALQQLAATQGPNSPAANPPAPVPQAPPTPPNLNPVAMQMLKQRLKQGLPPTPAPQAPPVAPPAPPPAAPQFNPTALQMLKQKLKQGLPPTPAPPAPPVEPPAPPPEPTPAPSFNPTALSMLKQKLKQGLPATPAEPPASPEIGDLMNKMTPAPAAPQGPQAPAPAIPEAPMIQKISKKLGKVKAEPYAEGEQPFAKDYEPLSDTEKWGAGLSDEAFAKAESAKHPDIAMPERYEDSIIRDRQKRRGVLADIVGDDVSSDADHAGDLLQELHHTRRAEKAHGAVHHFTAKMSPAMRAAIRHRMDKSFINSMWSK